MSSETKSEVWVGIDVGTQGVRVAAVDIDGSIVSSASAPLSSIRVDGRHTQSPMQWWEADTSSCKSCISRLEPSRVQGVALAATSGTVLLGDSKSRPISSALMYDDLRGAPYVERVNEVGQQTWERSGYGRMQPSWALPKILWLLDNTESSSVKVLHQSDFLNQQLVGHGTPTDLSSALKTGADLIAETWPEEIFAQLGVSLDILPPLVRSGSKLGTVSAEAAQSTGLPKGTPVMASMTDGCAAQLGAGVVTPGSWNSILGTTLVLKGVSNTLMNDPTGAVYSHRSPTGSWLPGGASSSGAGYLAQAFPASDLETLSSQAEEVDEVALGVTTYPLVGFGERFPFVAPAARSFTATKIGDSSTGSVAEVELFVAALLGIAAMERLSFEHLERLGASSEGRIVLSGGAARNDYLNQLRANVLGRELWLPTFSEAGLGPAVLAASQTMNLAEAAASMVRLDRVVEPNRPCEDYDEMYYSFVDQLADRGWLDSSTPVRNIQ